MKITMLWTETPGADAKEPPHIARQATFSKEPNLQVGSHGKSIKEFIEEQLMSTDPKRQAAARAAKQAWSMGYAICEESSDSSMD